MLVSVPVNSARLTLIDKAKRTWPDADLIGYLNEFLYATAQVKADFYPKRVDHALVAGAAQTLPADGVSLLRIDANVSGRTVNQVDFDLLNASNRFWPAGTAGAQVEDYAADPRDPRRFIVSPPNTGGGAVSLVYGAVPPAVTALADTFPVGDQHEPAAVAYILFRAYAMNTDRQDMGKSAANQQLWANFVGARALTQAATAPRVFGTPGTLPPNPVRPA